MSKPLAVSLGDPAGVGPELTCEAWARREAERPAPFFVTGGADVLRAAAATRGLDVPVTTIADPSEASAVFAEALPVLDIAEGPYRPGHPDTEGARLALASLEAAAAQAVQGRAGALVTGPIACAMSIVPWRIRSDDSAR